MMEDSGKFGFIVAPVVNAFLDLLLLPKAELEEFDLPHELTADMKATVKRLVKGNKKLEGKIVNRFKSSKGKLSHFKSIIR
jgi:hypothetical protein